MVCSISSVSRTASASIGIGRAAVSIAGQEHRAAAVFLTPLLPGTADCLPLVRDGWWGMKRVHTIVRIRRQFFMRLVAELLARARSSITDLTSPSGK
jgi:hypothetical protein